MLSTPELPELTSSAGASSPRTIDIDTTDPDRAMSVGRDVYHPHRIRLDSRTRRFRMGLKAIHLPNLTLGLLEYGHPVSVRTPPLQDSYQVNFTTFGSVSMGYANQTVQINNRRAAVHGLSEVTRMQGWGHPARVVGLKIPRVTLEQEFEALTGMPVGEPLRFDGDLDLASPGGQAWRATVQALAQGLDPTSPISTHPLLSGPLTQAAARGLLLAARHNHSHLLHTPAPTEPPETIKAALEFMHANADQPLSAEDMARAAGVSVRSLQAGFRKHLDTTPVAALRRIRLDRARQDLSSSPPGTRVAAIAERWGFRHVGRFAIHFAQAFGESPSETLARSS
ncbi:AraC family transcriptional regulator [Citricoccus zhacaiensis]|uniref:AraC family transcriptional regulator n=1 Tax=Citricoccus zhacaiensis TaxID=489142 RepID=UPI001666FC05|nr:AraC family transcriptional regulator [Citricoccus zhacaiensis]